MASLFRNTTHHKENTMAKLVYAMPNFDITWDVDNNPEILLMMAEQDDAECDATESRWRAEKAVTKPKHSNYDNKE